MTRVHFVPDNRPLITVDLDGVICSPLLGLNLGISRDFLDPAATPRPANVPPRWLSVLVDHARFDLRRPLRDARALAQLSQRRRIVILTGRRTSPAPWLRRYHLDSYIDSIVINTGPLRSAHFKLAEIERLRPSAHIDDDPKTTQLLAQASGIPVYLRDWPRNRDLEYDVRVSRITGLAQLVRKFNEMDAPSR